MAFKMQERVDPQTFGKLWKPVNPGEQLTGSVVECGTKDFKKTNKDGSERTESLKYLVVDGAATQPNNPARDVQKWQTPAHTDLVRRINAVKVGDVVQITLTGYGDKSSRKYSVGVDN